MKATGIVRKIDELGRIVLPMELRRTFNLNIKDSVEIYVESDGIVLKKYEPSCIFCGEATNITQFKGKNVCDTCKAEITKEREIFSLSFIVRCEAWRKWRCRRTCRRE